VNYAGTGAYFLEKVSEGGWRLEVYPDAVWVNDPFGQDSLQREVSRVFWREWSMRIRLPDLGESFAVEPLNEGNTFHSQARAGEFPIRPGLYWLGREKAPANVGLREFIAPPSKDLPAVVWHEPFREWVEGKGATLHFTVATSKEPESVILDFAGHEMPLSREQVYRYRAEIPGEWLKPGEANYTVTVRMAGETLKFPAAKTHWTLPVVARNAPIALFDANRHNVRLNGAEHRQRTVAGMTPGHRAAQLAVKTFGAPPSAVSFRTEATEELEPRRDALAGRQTLVLRVRSLETTTSAVEVVVVEHDGASWGSNVPLTTAWQEVRVPLASLHYMAHWGGSPATRGGKGDKPQPESFESVNVCFGAWLFPAHAAEAHTVEVESISVE
jgi:hypothetical protein